VGIAFARGIIVRVSAYVCSRVMRFQQFPEIVAVFFISVQTVSLCRIRGNAGSWPNTKTNGLLQAARSSSSQRYRAGTMSPFPAVSLPLPGPLPSLRPPSQYTLSTTK
jgi:hypothetical protein